MLQPWDEDEELSTATDKAASTSLQDVTTIDEAAAAAGDDDDDGTGVPDGDVAEEVSHGVSSEGQEFDDECEMAAVEPNVEDAVVQPTYDETQSNEQQYDNSKQ